jgi:hypothetical protein
MFIDAPPPAIVLIFVASLLAAAAVGFLGAQGNFLR